MNVVTLDLLYVSIFWLVGSNHSAIMPVQLDSASAVNLHFNGCMS